LASAIAALVKPDLLLWVNRGNLISAMLASVMCGTGLTLEKKDFADVFREGSWQAVPLGVLCQFTIMPLTAHAVGRLLLLGADPLLGPELFLGLLLVGCSPGGTASNLVSLIAGADVALSVVLTSCSTVAAVVATPLLVKLLLTGRGGAAIRVSGRALCGATARVVLLPVLLGMILKARAPGLARTAGRFTPFASVLLVSIICGGVVAQNAPLLQTGGAAAAAEAGPLLPTIVASVFLLHAIGFAAGYAVPRTWGALVGRRLVSEKKSRTISIEVGMQNSALAVVLARSIGAHPLACLPGALSATTHSCLGSMLAAFWRLRGAQEEGDDEPEYVI
jgi:BASS family bile acid:Na+ symporter